MATNSQTIRVLVKTNTSKILVRPETTLVSGELNSSPFLRQERDHLITVDSNEITFDKVTGDVSIALDDASKETIKVLADELSESEQVVVDLTKILSHDVDALEGIDTIGVTLNKIELIGSTDQITFNIDRVIETNQSVSDMSYIKTTKELVHDAIPSDNDRSLVFTLGLIADEVNVLESFIGYTFTDDEVDAIVTNQVGTIDDPEVTLDKILDTDTTVSADAIQSVDSTKVLTDAPKATDTFSRTFNAYKYFVDSTNVTETWFIQTPNSYVDQTYFSEFYVGDVIRSN